MYTNLAHATEKHIDYKESTIHLLETWYTAIPLYIIVTLGIFFITYYLSKKSINTSFVIISFWFLTTGIMLYDIAPTVSAIGIILGLLTSAIFAVGGLNKK
jgi:hypothetical protein